VVKNLGMLCIQANGGLISNEMNFVTAGGQLNPQFRPDYAAAAISGITGYSNFQTGSPCCLSMLNG